jgi:hypothetical protein
MELILTGEAGGKAPTPEEVRIRYGSEPDTAVRVIVARNGVMLISITDEPMSEALRSELEEWQSLSLLFLSMFPYHHQKEATK